MFPTSYFPTSYFTGNYWPPGAVIAPPPSPAPSPLGPAGGGENLRDRLDRIWDEDQHRERILREDEELLHLIKAIVAKGLLD